MKNSRVTLQGWTTVIIEIENNGPKISEILEELKYATILQVAPNTIINKHDEDIEYGWRIVFVTNQNESVINASIADILEIVQGWGG